MWWTGLTMAPVGPLSEYWHTRDYWKPVHLLGWKVGHWRFGVEDLLFGFAFAGISAGVFVWLSEKRTKRKKTASAGRVSPARMAFWAALLLALLALGTDGAGWNSTYSSMAAFIALSALFLFQNPTRLGPALATGGIAACSMWVFYGAFFTRVFPEIFTQWWMPAALTGFAFLGVPIEEPIWAFFAGAFCGLLYPHLLGPKR
ncbi:MAG: lycopene cyclase domain-containing protein [Nitrospinota bacterium]